MAVNGDENLNPLISGTRFNLSVDSPGSAGAADPELAFTTYDSLGTAIEYTVVNGAGQPCNDAVDPICYRVTEISGFSNGFNGWFMVEGRTTTALPPVEGMFVHFEVDYPNSCVVGDRLFNLYGRLE